MIIISQMHIINKTLVLYKKNLEIHCLQWKETPFCLEHRYYHADIMRSDYVGFFSWDKAGKLLFCMWWLSLSHITRQRPVIHGQFLTVLPLGRLKKKT